jgi:hypothetical protein
MISLTMTASSHGRPPRARPDLGHARRQASGYRSSRPGADVDVARSASKSPEDGDDLMDEHERQRPIEDYLDAAVRPAIHLAL